jgi:hypothetical protein
MSFLFIFQQFLKSDSSRMGLLWYNVKCLYQAFTIIMESRNIKKVQSQCSPCAHVPRLCTLSTSALCSTSCLTMLNEKGSARFGCLDPRKSWAPSMWILLHTLSRLFVFWQRIVLSSPSMGTSLSHCPWLLCLKNLFSLFTHNVSPTVHNEPCRLCSFGNLPRYLYTHTYPTLDVAKHHLHHLISNTHLLLPIPKPTPCSSTQPPPPPSKILPSPPPPMPPNRPSSTPAPSPNPP